MEPPVSEPRVPAARPAATAAPEPEEEPPHTRCAVGIPWVPRRAVVGVQAFRAVGELVHVELAEEDRAGVGEPRHDRGVRGRDPVGQDARAGGGLDSARAVEVLEGQGHSVERAQGAARHHRGLGRPRRLDGRLRRHREVRLELAVGGGDPVEVRLDHLDRRHLSLTRSGGPARTGTSTRDRSRIGPRRQAPEQRPGSACGPAARSPRGARGGTRQRIRYWEAGSVSDPAGISMASISARAAWTSGSSPSSSASVRASPVSRPSVEGRRSSGHP